MQEDLAAQSKATTDRRRSRASRWLYVTLAIYTAIWVVGNGFVFVPVDWAEVDGVKYRVYWASRRTVLWNPLRLIDYIRRDGAEVYIHDTNTGTTRWVAFDALEQVYWRHEFKKVFEQEN